MQNKSDFLNDTLFDDFFDPIDALPFAPDPMSEAVQNDVFMMSRAIEQSLRSIGLLLIREYERVLQEGAVRQRAEIVRRSAAAGRLADAPLDRRARRELHTLEQDIEHILPAEQRKLFEEFRKRLTAQYEWELEYARKFCENLNRRKLREWIAIVYDE